MDFSFLKKLKNKILHFNIFEIGNSVILYYLLIFFLAALATALLNAFRIKFIFINRDGVPWRAFIYAVFGLLTFIIGYFSPLGGYLARKIPNFLAGDWNFKRAKIAFWAFFIIGLASKILRTSESGSFSIYNVNPFGQSVYYGLMGYLDWFWYIAIPVAFIIYYRLEKAGDESYKKWKLLAFAILAVEVFYGISSCSRAAAIVPVLLYLLVKSYLSKTKYWQIICVAIAIAVILFPFGNACRNPFIVNSYKVFKSPIETHQSINFSNIDAVKTGSFATESFLGRMNQLFIFSKIVDAPPAVMASYGGSLSNFLTTLGPPKFLWPNKPLSTNSLGNDIGHSLGILSPKDFKTSIGPTIIGDLYINFGIWGIILGMFLMGVFFRLIYNYLIKLTGISSSGLLIYSVFWVQIIQGMENWITPVWAGLIKFFVLLIIVHLFLVVKKD